MIETALYQYLAAYIPLTSLVGTRIEPVVASQGTIRPNLVYFKIGDDRKFSLDGFSKLSATRLQLSCFADLYETNGSVIGAKNVAIQVIAAMEAWTGASGIQAVYSIGERDLFETETEIHHIPLDFIVWHSL
ncbi:MAG: hypothetical protein M0Q46_06220 [Endomicrobiales bacterium]|nr:hypothetical protein [Endomicrobiales bacterium]